MQMNMKLNEIGKMLAAHRKAQGMTQSQLGSLMGVQKSMVSKIETGACVNMASIEKMSSALGLVPVVDLRSAGKFGKDIIDYVMTAILEFASRYSLSVREASNYLNRFKGIDFLMEFYDVEHTLSFNDCVDDLTIICRNNGGELQ